MFFVNYFLEKTMGINICNKPSVIYPWIDDGTTYNIMIENAIDTQYKLFMTDSNGVKIDFPENTVLYMNKYNGKYDILLIDKVYGIYNDVKYYELHINNTIWDIRFDTKWAIEKRQNNINIKSV